MAENKLSVYSDEHFMKEALKEAQKAFERDEVPVGAVVVCNNQIIARAHNLTEQLIDVTAHAEMQAITSASNHLGAKFLEDCTLYVTVEPCPMCAGALFWSRMGKIVFGASDPKKGYSTISTKMLHPGTEIISGIMAKECGQIMTTYFKRKR
ncbi:MAG TPA: nucleoside deaminase [Bacteroidales bacterium]|nr:nucleoside deaminase [Bacteroidales bacterium]HPE57897.1 nucleoside deaminase [Bacteroidales bacterium]HRX97188.1 nucleoside deaminase [Bacteroidales bacterium]